MSDFDAKLINAKLAFGQAGNFPCWGVKGGVVDRVWLGMGWILVAINNIIDNGHGNHKHGSAASAQT